MHDSIQTFDTLFTTNHIQILKILLPHCPPSAQKQLALYIKYMELNYTMFYFKNHSSVFPPMDSSPDLSSLFSEILPFCSPKEQEQIKSMQAMTESMNNAREMMETINMMKDVFPEGASFGDAGGSSPFGGGDISDFMQLFQMLQN